MWINFSWSWKTSLLYIGPPSPHAVTKRALMKVKLQTVVPQHSRNQPPPSCTGFLVLQIFTVQQIWSKNKSHELRVNLSRRRIDHKKQRHVSSHEDIHVFAWVLYSQVFLVVNGRGLWTNGPWYRSAPVTVCWKWHIACNFLHLLSHRCFLLIVSAA